MLTWRGGEGGLQSIPIYSKGGAAGAVCESNILLFLIRFTETLRAGLKLMVIHETSNSEDASMNPPPSTHSAHPRWEDNPQTEEKVK